MFFKIQKLVQTCRFCVCCWRRRITTRIFVTFFMILRRLRRKKSGWKIVQQIKQIQLNDRTAHTTLIQHQIEIVVGEMGNGTTPRVDGACGSVVGFVVDEQCTRSVGVICVG